MKILNQENGKTTIEFNDDELACVCGALEKSYRSTKDEVKENLAGNMFERIIEFL